MDVYGTLNIKSTDSYGFLLVSLETTWCEPFSYLSVKITLSPRRDNFL